MDLEVQAKIKWITNNIPANTNYIEKKRGDAYLTVSYSVNGKDITHDELKDICITKKDYIDYVESVKDEIFSTRDKCA